MRTEEILRREAEYREVREALGTYLVDVVVGDLSAGLPPRRGIPVALKARPAGPSRPKAASPNLTADRSRPCTGSEPLGWLIRADRLSAVSPP